MRFLISRLSALGDTVCTLPAAVALRRTFPDCEIVWAVDPRFKGVVECCPAVDKVWVVKPGLKPQSWPQPEGEFDAAFDLQGLFKSGIIIARAKSKRKLGYHWQREGTWLFSRPVVPDKSSLHVVDQYVDVVRAAGAVADTAEFNLVPDEEAVSSVTEKLNGLSRFAVANAGAGWAIKRWPPAHFAQVIEWLADRQIPTVLIGGKAQGDLDAAEQVKALCKHQPLDLLGKTSIKELIALLSLADFHLGGDTGSSHITAALGKPCIGLYGPTRPARTCPYGQVDRCLYAREGLAAIQPQQVLELIEQIQQEPVGR